MINFVSKYLSLILFTLQGFFETNNTLKNNIKKEVENTF